MLIICKFKCKIQEKTEYNSKVYVSRGLYAVSCIKHKITIYVIYANC